MRLKKLRVTFFSFVPLLLETTITMLLLPLVMMMLLLVASSHALPAAAPPAPTLTSTSAEALQSSSSSSSSLSSSPSYTATTTATKSTSSAFTTTTTTDAVGMNKMLMSTATTYHHQQDGRDQLEDANSSKPPYFGESPYPTEAEKSHYQNQQFPTTHYTVTASLSTGTAEHEFHNPGKQQRDVDDDDDDGDGQDGSSLGHDYQNDQFHHYHDEQHDGPNRDNCFLPESWKGRWFQSGVSSPILIDSKSMAEKGTCYERSGDKFLFVASEKNQDCFRCIVINERHKNVLQYKESSYCEEKNSLENLCSQIPGDAQLYSLFRVDAQSEDCPFKGAPFTFTYNRGHGECKNPVSYVDTCTESSRLLLRYQACPDVQKTESTSEELQCLAQWKEGSHHYLVGKLTRERTIPTNEESYRCFIYEKTKSGHGGYTVAMSGDATCTGVASSTEGARTLTFSKVDKAEGKCAFPAWVASHHWHTLDGKMSAKMHHKNSTMHITEDNRRNSSGHYSLSGGGSSLGLSGLPLLGSGSAGISLGGIGAVGVAAGTNAGTSGGLFSASSSLSSSLFTGGTRIVCQSRVDIVEGRHVAIVAKHTQGCKTENVCMHIYQRAKHVTEIQMLRKSDQMSDDFECGKANALGPTLPYVTLVNPEAKSNRCPNLGKYMATGVSTDGRVVRDSCGTMGQGGFHSLVVGCGEQATMEFHSKCSANNPIRSYECHGSWEENGTGFLIASSLSRSSTSARRYCFNYQETDDGLRVFSSSESCRRNVSPGIEGVWAFNLTIDGQCAQAVRSGSSQFKACDLLIAASMISFLTFTSVFQIMLVLQSSPFIRSLRPSSSSALPNSSRSRRHSRTNSTSSNNSTPSSAVAISACSNANITTTTSPHDFTSLTTFRTDTSTESETTATQSTFISGGMTSRIPCSLVSR